MLHLDTLGKVEAINCHQSQVGSLQPTARNFSLTWGTEIGDDHGLPGRLAEKCRRIDTP
jgi:hypothetical protein